MLKESKRLAKKALNGNRGKAAVLFIVPAAFFLLIVLIASLASLLTGFPLLSETANAGIDALFYASPWTYAISLGGALIALIFYIPYRMGVKRWYMRLFDKIRLAATDSVGAIAPKVSGNNPDFDINRRFDEETEVAGADNAAEAESAPETPERSTESLVTPEEKEHNGSVGAVFDFFCRAGKFFGSFWFRIIIAVRSLLWLLLFSLPGAILLGVQLWVIGVFNGGDVIANIRRVFSEEYLVLLPSFALIVFTWLMCGVFLLRYFAADYIWSDSLDKNPMSMRMAIKLSTKVMKGQKLNVILGTISFFFWWVLCLFILPTLYVCPYFEAFKAAIVHKAVYGKR